MTDRFYSENPLNHFVFALILTPRLYLLTIFTCRQRILHTFLNVAYLFQHRTSSHGKTSFQLRCAFRKIFSAPMCACQNVSPNDVTYIIYVLRLTMATPGTQNI